MSQEFTRRGILTAGLAAGALAAGRLARLASAEPSPRASDIPDESPRAPALPVAIQRCRTYEPQPLRAALEKALDLVGGVKSLVGGKTVSVKINVTAGPGKLGGLPSYRTYHVHPNMVAALCGILADAGARRIVIVESQFSAGTPEEVLGRGGWDIKAIRSAGAHRVTFEDTRNRGPWRNYCRLAVPWGGFVFPAFLLNQRYEKTDVFISLAKLKEHINAGVTMSVKNLFGITPLSLYGSDKADENGLCGRGDVLHYGKQAVAAGIPAEVDQKEPRNWRYRLPRVTADLFGARPVDLAIIDGIETNRGGEGPWCINAEPIKPGVLLAGRNGVCTDAIGTAVMGFDPMAPHWQHPFPGDNHLLLLAQVGVGAADPKRIEVRGVSVKEAVFPYNPKRQPRGELEISHYLPPHSAACRMA